MNNHNEHHIEDNNIQAIEKKMADEEKVEELFSSKFSPEKRFGIIIATEHWGIVPYPLYRYQKKLELNNSQVWFLTWLIIHQWTEDNPYPSQNALARRSGRSRQYIYKLQKSLVEKGLLRVSPRYFINGGRKSNAYDLEPLYRKLEEIIREDGNSKFNNILRKNVAGAPNYAGGG